MVHAVEVNAGGRAKTPKFKRALIKARTFASTIVHTFIARMS